MSTIKNTALSVHNQIFFKYKENSECLDQFAVQVFNLMKKTRWKKRHKRNLVSNYNLQKSSSYKRKCPTKFDISKSYLTLIYLNYLLNNILFNIYLINYNTI